MGDRARAFATRLDRRWQVHTAYRSSNRAAGVAAFGRWLSAIEADVVYVFDMALAGVVAGAWDKRRRGSRLIVDTGDAITALVRSSGMRGPLGLAATALLERFSLRTADHIVVRGSFHRELLARQGIEATVIPDGVDLRIFSPGDGLAARQRLRLGNELIVGLVGSSVWSPALEIAYGWDLVELLALVRDLPVRGLLVGDGSGIERLRERARVLGVEDRIVFAGRRPLTELPGLLAACDICLSTQTNDIPVTCAQPANCRSTSPAGGSCWPARSVRLPASFHKRCWSGTWGRSIVEYPARLAERVRAIAGNRAGLGLGQIGVSIAREHFDYDLLVRRVETVLAGNATIPFTPKSAQ